MHAFVPCCEAQSRSPMLYHRLWFPSEHLSVPLLGQVDCPRVAPDLGHLTLSLTAGPWQSELTTSSVRFVEA